MDSAIQDLIIRHDPDNLFSILSNSYRQVEKAWGVDVSLPKGLAHVRHILFCGMGGSAISGNLALNFLRDELLIPFFVNRSYAIPAWAGKETLVIASSYSGNTEETLSAFEEARGRGCHIICIANGGELGKRASEAGVPCFSLVEGLQPRFALYSIFFTLLKILENLGIVPAQSGAVEEISLLLKNNAARYREGGKAFELAEKMMGGIIIAYSAEGITDAVGMRLKAQLNENSKAVSYHATIPEMNHNEIVAWESAREMSAKCSAVFILDEAYHPRLMKQYDAAMKVISQTGADVFELSSAKPNHKLRLFDLVYLSDWISYYLAILNNKNPGEIDNIHAVKKYLRGSE
jgi:glucose/mannose-6-phosphate isomerase